MTELYSWVTDNTRKFMKKGYLTGQSVEERCEEISTAFRNNLIKMGLDEKTANELYEEHSLYLAEGLYSKSTPVWVSYGNDRGLPIACYNSHVPDNMDGIMYAAGEIGMLTKLGGGTSAYLGDIRPRGTPITGNGEADGPAHFARLYNAVMQVARQGSRRGYLAAYLDATHPDIGEFLKIGSDSSDIQNITTGVCFSDLFMKNAYQGVGNASEVLAEFHKARGHTGYPYALFTDNANRGRPQVYKDLGLEIKSSNLCMVGSDRVVSSNGYLTAKELYELDKELILFDGVKPVKASKMMLREKDADVYTITLANGMKHSVTKYHGIPVVDGKDSYIRKECKDLVIGDKVLIQTQKGLFGNLDMQQEAFLLGMYQSDGTQHKDTIMLDVWENDFDLIDEIQKSFNYIHYKYGCDVYNIIDTGGVVVGSRNRTPAQFVDCSISNGTVAKKRLSSKTLKKALNFEKGYIPDWIWEANEATQWQYVRGLLYADGAVHMSSSNGAPIQLAYTDISKKFLEELQILFQNLGLQTSIRLLRVGGETLLPDGKGSQKYYTIKDAYQLIVDNKNDALSIEDNTGFLSRKGIVLEDREYRDNTKKAYEVVSIEYVGKEDVYCPTVYTNEHVFVAQGMLTFNCNEIMLPSTDDESFVCVLSSMNLTKWNHPKFARAVRVLIYFLDTVIYESIEKLKKLREKHKYHFLDRIERFLTRHRALGMGVLGWHHLLQSKMIPFESRDAARLNVEVFKLLQTESYAASKELAQWFGEPELLKGYGMRNTTTMAIAPTKSSSFILGNVSEGIQPELSNCYLADLAKETVVVKNPYLEEWLESVGRNTVDVWESIQLHAGSIGQFDWIPDHIKDVFKTFPEINPKAVIDQAATRQVYIDQGQSLNLIFHPDVTAGEINHLFYYAWQMGIKGLYYQIGMSAVQAHNTKKLNMKTCSSCEG